MRGARHEGCGGDTGARVVCGSVEFGNDCMGHGESSEGRGLLRDFSVFGEFILIDDYGFIRFVSLVGVGVE